MNSKIFRKISAAFLFAVCALTFQTNVANASLHQAVYVSNSGWAYSVHYNNLDHQVSYMTQLAAGDAGVFGITDVYTGGVAYAVGNFILPAGQSAIINAIPQYFSSVGDGTLTFLNGSTITLADLLPFTGQLSTFNPSPDQVFPCSSSPTCFQPVSNDVAVAGFNLASGQHPTALGGFGDIAPTDGIAIPGGSSIVMFWAPSVTHSLGIASVGFNVNNGIIASSSYAGQTLSRPTEVPEPGTMALIMSSALFGIPALRKKRS